MINSTSVAQLAVLAMQKKIKTSSDSGDCGSNTCKQGPAASPFGASLDSSGRFCVGAFVSFNSFGNFK
jgi:hypothetical protein